MVWNNTVLRAGQSSDDESLGNSQCGIFINTGFKGKVSDSLPQQDPKLSDFNEAL